MTDDTPGTCMCIVCDEPVQASSDKAGVDAKPVAPYQVLLDEHGNPVMGSWEFKEGDVVLSSIKRVGQEREMMPSYQAIVVKVHDKTADGRPGQTVTVFQQGRQSWGSRAETQDFEGEMAILDHLHFHCKPYVHVEPMHMVGDVVLIKGTTLHVKIVGVAHGTTAEGRRQARYNVKSFDGLALDVKALSNHLGRELSACGSSPDTKGPFYARDFTRSPRFSRAPPCNYAKSDIYTLLKEVLTGAEPSPRPPLPASIVSGGKRPGDPAESSRVKRANKSPSPPPFSPEEEEEALAASPPTGKA